MGRLFQPKAAAPQPEPTPAPKPELSEDKVKAIISESMGGVVGELRNTLGALAERITELGTRQPQVVVQPQPVHQPAQPNITEDELDTAVQTGLGAGARIRALVDRAVRAESERIVREHINPLQEFGVTSLANIATEMATNKMPYYQKYKKDIDQRLAVLDPSIRANPAALKMIHDAVVGEHAAELVSEAGEAAIRRAQEEASKGTATAGTGSGRDPRREVGEVPNAEAIGGRDALDALSHKGHGGRGQSEDELAQAMGYKSWAAYMKQYDELVAAETKGNA